MGAKLSPETYKRPGPLHRRFTSLGAAVDLTENGPVGSEVKHLPCSILVEVATTAGTNILELTDVLGNVAAIPFATAGIYPLPYSPASIGGAATTGVTVTVFWQTGR